MSRITYYIETARPKTLIASFAPISLIGTLHMTALRSDFLILIAILLGTLLIQILTNFFNDYYDLIQGQDTSKRLGPKRPFQRGELNHQDMIKALLSLTVVYFLITIPICQKLKFLGIFFSILSFVLSIYYTKGNFSLAKLGLSDFFSFTFFGPIATSMTGYALTNQFSLKDTQIGLITGSLSTILLVINHLRDEKEDRENHKTTSVVRFGRIFGISLIYLFLAIISITPFFIASTKFSYFFCAMILGLSIFFLKEFKLCKTSNDYARLLPKAAKFYMIQFLLLMAMLCSFHIR